MPSYEYTGMQGGSVSFEKEYKDLLKAIEKKSDPTRNAVLLIDDERSIRRKVARDIKANDDTVIIYEAGNGQEGLDKIAEIREKHKQDPVFIVCDLQMPVMDGWDFIEHLRKEYEEAGKTQGIPIVVLSSTAGDKGIPLFKKSVHGGRAKYSPMITVAKETCIKPQKYDATGEKGLMAWMKYFLNASQGSHR